LAKKQSGAVVVRLFEDEIKQLQRSYPEALNKYDEKTGKLTIGKGKETMWDYELVSGSTYAVDQETQQRNLSMLLDLFRQAQTPQGFNWLEEKLKTDGFNFKFGELFKRVVTNSGIQDWDKIVEEMTEEEKADVVLEKDKAQLMQIIQQMQGGVEQVPPEQGMEQPGQAVQGI
jgi:hypothetical protein